MTQTEHVLVVRRSLLDSLGTFQGLKPAVNDYLPVFLNPANHFFVPRPEAEEDPSLKQLIPYIVVTCGGSILHYRRGGTSGEKRLARARGRSASAATSMTETVLATPSTMRLITVP